MLAVDAKEPIAPPRKIPGPVGIDVGYYPAPSEEELMSMGDNAAAASVVSRLLLDSCSQRWGMRVAWYSCMRSLLILLFAPLIPFPCRKMMMLTIIVS